MPDATYQVSIGDRTLHVAIRQAGDDLLVRVDDGEEIPASVSPVHGALYALSLGEQHIELLADAESERVTLAIGGLEYRAEVVDEAHARLAAVAAARGVGHARHELRAPMPGLLVRVLCQPGDSIQAGQPLAVLQAMKMENELSLAYGGTVKQVNGEAGQTVEQGQVLVVVE